MIELLVVTAIIAILVSLLLPSVDKAEEAAREAARKKLLADQGISTKITDFPCVAPNCDFLQQGATFMYPLIPVNLTAAGVLQSGLFVTYDANNLAQQPFALVASAPATGTAYDVSFDLRGAGVEGDDFSIVSDAYDSSILEFLVRQTSDDALFELSADVDQNPIAFVGTQASIPEPAMWSLVVGGFALMGFRERRRRRGPG